MVADTRERILTATIELFRRQGYVGTGLKAISADSGAPFGSLYHHFPGGKQELAAEAIRAGGRYFQALVMATYDEQASTADSLDAVFKGAAETLQDTGFINACPIATVALEVASTDEVLRLATAEVFEMWTKALTERLGERQHALAILAALEGAFVLSRAWQSTEPMEAARSMVIDYLRAAVPTATQ